ncbi:MAG: ATP-binding protein [Chloroflexi bacterium]|nr:ATP-binding protein [Chloroflexota bacterium]
MIIPYQKHISGTLLDRIDIHIEVPRVDYEKLRDDRLGELSSEVQTRVEAARELQRTRLAEQETITCNADMGPAEVRIYCELSDEASSLISSAMSQMQLSARAYHRVLKLSRTIADLAGETEIGPEHLAEALQYRSRLA